MSIGSGKTINIIPEQMNVQKLINRLSELPFDADVKIVYDGEPRMNVDHVFENGHGDVIITGENQPLYSDEARPKYSPSEYEEKVIKTAKVEDI